MNNFGTGQNEGRKEGRKLLTLAQDKMKEGRK